MELQDLYDKRWNQWEKKRFLNDDTKSSTDSFDPEEFKHEGFDDREQYVETFVPALAENERLEQELNNFTPPRLSSINGSPYQALVIRYGILRTLIRQQDYSMEKDALLDAVKSWQKEVIESFDEDAFGDDDNLLHLAQAASEYKNDIDDSELHLIHQYTTIRNGGVKWNHDHVTWLDFFQRLSSIGRFPKVSRSEKPSHAIDTIEKGLWSLQEQAIVYEVVQPDTGDLVGIPVDYVDYVSDWLHFEMNDENYLTMLDELEPFDNMKRLNNARDIFEVESQTHGRNQKRRESLVEAGVYPSDLLREVMQKDELKQVVDRYGLDAHKLKTEQMINATIRYFEQSQAAVDEQEPTAELYLDCYEDIADGNFDHIPPQLVGVLEDESDTLDILFEQGTAEIFEDIFGIEGTKLLGQQASGTVADGEIEQGGKWLLWDNKRRAGVFKLDASTRAKIKSYIDTKNQQHDVEWFLIIAPAFADSAEDNAVKLEMQTGVDIRLVTAENIRRLALIWQDNFAMRNRELPLSVFTGTGCLDLDLVRDSLETQFS